jgi:hypothetical protein
MPGYSYSECFGSGYCDNGVVYTDVVTIGQIVYQGMPIMVQTNNTSKASGGIRSGNLGLNCDPNGMSTSPERLPSYFQHLLPYLECKPTLFSRQITHLFISHSGTFQRLKLS